MDTLILKAEVSADEVGTVKGRAWAWSPDSVGDEIMPGAFDGLALPLPILMEHNKSTAIGAWTYAESKADGLHVTGRLFVPGVPRAGDAYAQLKSGRVTGLSIGFSTRKATPLSGGGRRFESIELNEISLCRVPIHRGARITATKSVAAELAAILTAAAAAIRKA